MFLISVVLGASVSAQSYSDEIELLGDENGVITLLSSATHEKKKEAQELATRSAFNSLFHSGIEGVKSKAPMISVPRSDYDFRFFNENRYLNYIVGVPAVMQDTKMLKQHKVTVKLAINTKTLRTDIERNNLTLNPAWADKKKVNPTAALNPTIVVVPYVDAKWGYSAESMRNKLESSYMQRAAVSEVTRFFVDNGFKTRNIVNMLQNAKNDQILRSNAQTDDATMQLQNLMGDIIVIVEAGTETNENKQSGIKLNLQVIEKQTSGDLGRIEVSGGDYYTTDTLRLITAAIKNIRNDFISQINNSFEAMVKKGREVTLDLNLSESVSDWDFDQDSPASGEYFKDAFEEWLRANSHQSVYDMSLSTDKYVKARVNVPLWDYEKNRSYSLSNFSSDLRKFFKAQLGEDYKPKITAMGQEVMITIE
jgi:hypothetical protein